MHPENFLFFAFITKIEAMKKNGNKKNEMKKMKWNEKMNEMKKWHEMNKKIFFFEIFCAACWDSFWSLKFNVPNAPR